MADHPLNRSQLTLSGHVDNSTDLAIGEEYESAGRLTMPPMSPQTSDSTFGLRRFIAAFLVSVFCLHHQKVVVLIRCEGKESGNEFPHSKVRSHVTQLRSPLVMRATSSTLVMPSSTRQ